MNIFSKTINSKLKLVTFVILPVIIITLVILGIYLVTSQNKTTQEIGQVVSELEQNSQQTSSVTSEIETADISRNKSFDELNNSSKTAKTTSSIIALSSPIANSPEQDLKEVETILDKLESTDLSGDQTLDAQIISN
jgi:exonuclease VII small subunit